MDFANKEGEIVETFIGAAQAEIQELDDLQMAVVGGGSADPIAF